MAFPILVFLPVGQPILRRLGLLLVGFMHLGIALTVPLVEFLLVLGASYLLFFSQAVTSEAAQQAKSRLIWKAATSVLLGLLMILVLWKNADNFRRYEAMILPPIPSPISVVLDATGLNQGWDLFSPNPIKVDWSIVVPGTFNDQTVYDVRTGNAPRNALTPVSLGPEYRWKQLELIVAQSRSAPLLGAWSNYYCRLYNDNVLEMPARRLAGLQFLVMYRHSHEPGQPARPVESDVIWIHNCHTEQRDS
jgi:hypothetical protein